MKPVAVLTSRRILSSWRLTSVQMLLATTPEEPHGALLVLGLLSVPLLVLLNGLFVATEFALVAVRRTRVEEMVSQGISGATAVENAVTHLNRSIAATQ